MSDPRETTKGFENKLSKIKVFATDVDGVLTDGRLFYQGEEMGFNRFFHSLDGFGLKMMMQAGIKTGIISGGDSKGLDMRVDNLKLDFAYTGNEDKVSFYNDLKKKYSVKDEEILYIGDEFFDLPILNQVGFSATVPHASFEIRESVDYVTTREGGCGAVREIVDMVRYVQGIIPKV